MSGGMRARARALLGLARAASVWILMTGPAAGQDMEPRAYSASPVGANFLVLGMGRSTGSVLLDPTLPLTDVEAELNAAIVGLGRTFGVADRMLLVTAALPYSWGTISGKVGEQAAQVRRSGLADVRAKVSMNLRGNPAATPAEFAKMPRRTIVGTSLTVSAPSGQYDPVKLINLGTNRWAFKPEVGISYPAGRWDLDVYAGVWLFTANDAFYTGERRRKQDPIYTLQGHVSYSIKRRAWAAFDATWYAGGKSRVDDDPPSERQNNTRIGATLSWPITRGQSVKVGWSTGASTRTGTDFTTVAVAWQVLWFD